MGKFHNIRKLETENSKYKKTCSCGHVMVVYPNVRKGYRNYVICRWCGKRVYRNAELQKQQDEQVKKEAFRMELWRTLCQ